MKTAFEAREYAVKNHFSEVDENMLKIISDMIDKSASKGEFSVDTYILQSEVSNFVQIYLNNLGYHLRYHQHEIINEDSTKIYFSTLYISWILPEEQISPTKEEIVQDRGRIYQ